MKHLTRSTMAFPAAGCIFIRALDTALLKKQKISMIRFSNSVPCSTGKSIFCPFPTYFVPAARRAGKHCYAGSSLSAPPRTIAGQKQTIYFSFASGVHMVELEMIMGGRHQKRYEVSVSWIAGGNKW